MTHIDSTARLIHHFEHGLARALQSVTGRQFSIAPETANPAEAFEDPLVWHQTVSTSANPGLWLAAPRDLWTMAGRVTLEAAGLGSTDIGDQECRSTWSEICVQAMTAVVAGIATDAEREVTAGQGGEASSEPAGLDWTWFAVRSDDGQMFRLRAAWSAEVTGLFERTPAPDAEHLPDNATVSKTFDLLLDVSLPVSVSFGKTSLQIREVLKLSTGSIVELNRLVSEPVAVIVNDCVIARGEVVVIEGNYGVRVTQLASREDRLKTGMREAHSRIGERP